MFSGNARSVPHFPVALTGTYRAVKETVVS